MSGMRPTGKLHLGHLVGALTNWVELGATTEAYFEVADLHAFTTGFEDPQAIRDNRDDMVLDWLAAGIDPARSTLFLQSAVPEISELHALLSMIVPVAWLQRVPTYKDQIEALGPEIATYGFLATRCCSCATSPCSAPTRCRSARTSSRTWSSGARSCAASTTCTRKADPTLVEPEALLSEFPALPGSDGRKMSKSYHNTIDIADDEQATFKKVRSFVTDPLNIRRNDPGRPEICPVFALHHLSNAARVPEIREGCASGALGCVACKTELAESLNAFLRPVRERRAAIDRARVAEILRDGSERAREVANQTMRDVRAVLHIADV